MVACTPASPITLLAAAGDGGATSGENGPACKGYEPAFPASSPYVTAVGATMGAEDGPASAEVVCSTAGGSHITSGGGFSSVYPRPPWQDAQVQAFLERSSSEPTAPGFNATGRAYPDVSLAGSRYAVVVGGRELTVYGTSAATPVAAGMITLINAQLARAGRPSVGWINPTLYATASEAAFNDVTSGNNSCAGLGEPCCEEGFRAGIGWDAASGLGSFDFQRLAALFTAPLPPPPSPPPPPVPSGRGIGVGLGIGLGGVVLCTVGPALYLLGVAVGKRKGQLEGARGGQGGRGVPGEIGLAGPL